MAIKFNNSASSPVYIPASGRLKGKSNPLRSAEDVVKILDSGLSHTDKKTFLREVYNNHLAGTFQGVTNGYTLGLNPGHPSYWFNRNQWYSDFEAGLREEHIKTQGKLNTRQAYHEGRLGAIEERYAAQEAEAAARGARSVEETWGKSAKEWGGWGLGKAKAHTVDRAASALSHAKTIALAAAGIAGAAWAANAMGLFGGSKPRVEEEGDCPPSPSFPTMVEGPVDYAPGDIAAKVRPNGKCSPTAFAAKAEPAVAGLNQ